MIFVDNTLGMTLQIGGERDIAIMKFYDSFVFGESTDIADDCPVANDCYCKDKAGLLLFSHNRGSKPIMSWADNLPFYKIRDPSGWGGQVEITDVTFKNFKSKQTRC